MSIIQKLKTEGVLKLYHDYRSREVTDKSDNGNDGTMTSTKWTGQGIQCSVSGANIEVADSADLQLTEGTLILLANFKTDNYTAEKRVISKRDGGGTNYDLRITKTTIVLYDGTNTRSLTTNTNNKKYIAVNFGDGTIAEGFIDGTSVGNFNGTSDISVNDAPLQICNGSVNPASFMDSNTEVAMIINRKLTATEHSQLYGELESLHYPTKPYTKEKDFRNDELTDGDMEASGTSAWTAGGSTTLSKETNSPKEGSQWLKVLKASTGFGAAQQLTVLTIGNTYRIRGYATSDGTVVPKIYDSGAALLWTGNTSTDWQYFDITITAIGVRLDLASLFLASGYVGYDDVQVIDLGKNYSALSWHSDWGVNQSKANVTSGYLENSPFQVQSGSFKITMDTIDGQDVKVIECISAGDLLFPSEIDGDDTDWTGWEDTGAGYSENTLSLSSLVYSMGTGDKIAYSDIKGDHSIIKKI